MEQLPGDGRTGACPPYSRIPEVHVNTIEGLWTGLRNFLRPFRGVNKIYLQQYLAIHEWAHNLKEVTLEFLRIVCGVTQIAS